MRRSTAFNLPQGTDEPAQTAQNARIWTPKRQPIVQKIAESCVQHMAPPRIPSPGRSVAAAPTAAEAYKATRWCSSARWKRHRGKTDISLLPTGSAACRLRSFLVRVPPTLRVCGEPGC